MFPKNIRRQCNVTPLKSIVFGKVELVGSFVTCGVYSSYKRLKNVLCQYFFFPFGCSVEKNRRGSVFTPENGFPSSVHTDHIIPRK